VFSISKRYVSLVFLSVLPASDLQLVLESISSLVYCYRLYCSIRRYFPGWLQCIELPWIEKKPYSWNFVTADFPLIEITKNDSQSDLLDDQLQDLQVDLYIPRETVCLNSVETDLDGPCICIEQKYPQPILRVLNTGDEISRPANTGYRCLLFYPADKRPPLKLYVCMYRSFQF